MQKYNKYAKYAIKSLKCAINRQYFMENKQHKRGFYRMNTEHMTMHIR